MPNDKKYIKRISYGSSETYDIKDDEAVNTINGFSNAAINAGTVTFASKRIDNTEIDDIFKSKVLGGDR